MNNNRIEFGDHVGVDIAKDLPTLEGIVLYIPCATGDSWIIKGRRDWIREEEEIFYIQNFRYIVLRKKGEQNAKTR